MTGAQPDRSHRLEQPLIAADERVVRVAPKLMGASRRGERDPGSYPGELQRITRHLGTMPQTVQARIAREQAKRIGVLTREAEALKRELRDLVRLYRPELLAETGCGDATCLEASSMSMKPWPREVA